MKNKIKGFTFFENYFIAIEEMENEEDKKDILLAIVNYVFNDKIPKYTGTKKIVWTLIEPYLNTSKNRSNTNAGAPKDNDNACKKQSKNNQKTIKKQSKNNQRPSYSYSNSIFYFNSNINKLFIEYLDLRIKNKYEVTETIVNRLINKLKDFSEKEQEEMILNAINGSWKDFYASKETKYKSKVPEWFNQKFEKEEETSDGRYNAF